MESKASHDEWIFLKSAGPSYELEIISSMLDQLQIPVLKKSSDKWNIPPFIMGESMTGYDIYVPSTRITEAREMLDNIQPIEQDLSYEETLQLEDQQPGYIHTKPGSNKLLVILIIIFSLFGLLVAFKDMLD